MRTNIFVIALLMVMQSAIPAQSGTIAKMGAKAEALLDDGNPVGAIEALDAAMEVIWQKSPLLFRKALFVESTSGFGIYSEKSPAVFKVGEALLVYAEPVGFAYGKNSVGSKEIHLIADFVLNDGNGKTLISKDDFLKLVLPVRYNNREFQMNMTVNLTGLSPGNYVSKFHIRDKHSDKSGDFELAFEMVE